MAFQVCSELAQKLHLASRSGDGLTEQKRGSVTVMQPCYLLTVSCLVPSKVPR